MLGSGPKGWRFNSSWAHQIWFDLRRDRIVVECTRLEGAQGRKVLEGSNPSLSACLVNASRDKDEKSN